MNGRKWPVLNFRWPISASTGWSCWPESRQYRLVLFGEIRWLDLARLYGSQLTRLRNDAYVRPSPTTALCQASVAESSVVLPPVIREHTHDPSYPP